MDGLISARPPRTGTSNQLASASHSLQDTGDWIYSIAVVFLVYRLSDQLAVAAGVLLIQGAARLAGSGLTGSITSDHARRVVVGVSLLRAALIASLIAVTSRDQLWLPLIVAAIVGVTGPAFDVARQVSAPVTIEPDRTRYLRTRLLARWDQMAMIVGGIISGLLIVAWSERAAFSAAVLFVLVALALFLRIRAPQSGQSGDTYRRRQVYGWTTLRRVRKFRNVVLALACGAALGITIRIILVEIVLDEQGGSELVYGLFVALAAAGAFAGPISVPRLLGKLPSEVILAGVLIALSAALVAIRAADPLALLIPVMIGCGLLAVTGERVAETVTRRIVHDRDLDGALPLLSGAAVVGQVLALAIVAPFAWRSGLTTIVLAMASGGILLSGLLILDYSASRFRRLAASGRYDQTFQPDAVQD